MMLDLDGDTFRDRISDWPSVVGKLTALKPSSLVAVGLQDRPVFAVPSRRSSPGALRDDLFCCYTSYLRLTAFGRIPNFRLR